ncbi:unnamed protein product, partial [marine sediment metagenome]
MRHGVVILAVSSFLFVLCAVPVHPAGEHGPYADWIPSGTLDVGDESSEAAFSYTAEPESQALTVTHVYGDGEKVAD